MFLKLMNWKKGFMAVAMGILVCTGCAKAADEWCVESKSITIMGNFPTDESRGNIVRKVFSQPNISLFDLSFSNIEDTDVKAMAEGLAIRNHQQGNKTALKLLDISKEESISANGIKNLLGFFQKGFSKSDLGLENNTTKVYPDVREVIIKVASDVDVTEELLSQWARHAPSVFSGGLRIID